MTAASGDTRLGADAIREARRGRGAGVQVASVRRDSRGGGADARVRPRREQDGVVVRVSQTVVVLWRDVSGVEARGNRVALHAPAGCFFVRTTIAAMARRLQPHGFVRVHRSWLVRPGAVLAVEPLAKGDALLTLRDGVRVRASRTYKDAIDRLQISPEAGESPTAAQSEGRATPEF